MFGIQHCQNLNFMLDLSLKSAMQKKHPSGRLVFLDLPLPFDSELYEAARNLFPALIHEQKKKRHNGQNRIKSPSCDVTVNSGLCPFYVLA